MTSLAKKLRRLAADTQGATAIEYGLIAALIAVAIIGGLTAVATSINDTFETVETQVA